jgi:hypothetical protein
MVVLLRIAVLWLQTALLYRRRPQLECLEKTALDNGSEWGSLIHAVMVMGDVMKWRSLASGETQRCHVCGDALVGIAQEEVQVLREIWVLVGAKLLNEPDPVGRLRPFLRTVIEPVPGELELVIFGALVPG